jgi:hypothetical protein
VRQRTACCTHYHAFASRMSRVCFANHPEQPGRLAARLLYDPGTKPRHFGDVMLTGKLLSPNVYFQIELKKHNRTEYAKNGPRKQYCFTVSICHLVKVDLKYLTRRTIWSTHGLSLRSTFSHSFFRIQDGSKRDTFYLVPRSRKKSISRDENASRMSLEASEQHLRILHVGHARHMFGIHTGFRVRCAHPTHMLRAPHTCL